jgi:hypothetical protein
MRKSQSISQNQLLLAFFRFYLQTIQHKWFVFLGGLKLRVPIHQLLLHDWTKFTPTETIGYTKYIFVDSMNKLDFDYAWSHHQKHNPHHWEYWVLVGGHNQTRNIPGLPLPMPERFIREMVADWFGACRAYEGFYPTNRQEWPWLQENLEIVKANMHPTSADMLDQILRQALGETNN